MTLLLREAETTQTLFSANTGNSLKSSHVRRSFFYHNRGSEKELNCSHRALSTQGRKFHVCHWQLVELHEPKM